jgi:hypothetical protein
MILRYLAQLAQSCCIYLHVMHCLLDSAALVKVVHWRSPPEHSVLNWAGVRGETLIKTECGMHTHVANSMPEIHVRPIISI